MTERKPRVLFVDDEPHIVLAMSKRLQAAGYDVITAEDGEDALAKAQEAPDLIILDLMLPKRSGLDVCATLRKETRYDTIPIILYTGVADEDVARRFGTPQYSLQMWGGDAYVRKDAGSPALLKSIGELLSKRRFGGAAPTTKKAPAPRKKKTRKKRR